MFLLLSVRNYSHSETGSVEHILCVIILIVTRGKRWDWANWLDLINLLGILWQSGLASMSGILFTCYSTVHCLSRMCLFNTLRSRSTGNGLKVLMFSLIWLNDGRGCRRRQSAGLFWRVLRHLTTWQYGLWGVEGHTRLTLVVCWTKLIVLLAYLFNQDFRLVFRFYRIERLT